MGGRIGGALGGGAATFATADDPTWSDLLGGAAVGAVTGVAPNHATTVPSPPRAGTDPTATGQVTYPAVGTSRTPKTSTQKTENRMRLRTHAVRALAVLSVATAGFLAAGAPASAATTEFSQTQTLANGALICGGNIRAWANTDPGWGNNAILNIQALPLNGFGSSAVVRAGLRRRRERALAQSEHRASG